MKRIKQCVGIDIAKDSFTACIASASVHTDISYSEIRTFKNEKTGFNQLIRWVRKQCVEDVDLVFLMEATGVYYEQFAHHLSSLKQTVHVVLPNTSKHFFASLNIKTKTDEIDAKILSRFGVERKHKNWVPPRQSLLHLRNLTRYYVQLQEQKTALGNIKHSKESSHDVQKLILSSNRTLIKQIDTQITRIRVQIQELINKDAELKRKVDLISTIKGVGLITIATIIAETLGFEHVKNAKQLVSYAGYDVVQRESGTSIKGKTRISKKGNRYIRNCLYFPAMVACRYNETLKANYLRVIQKKPSKMIGQVAIQRKLLILIYTIWKNETIYKTDYKKVVPLKSETTLDRSPEGELL